MTASIDRDAFDADLRAAGIPSGTAILIAAALAELDPAACAAAPQRQAAALLALARAGIPGGQLHRLTNVESIARAVDLLDRGIPAEAIVTVIAREDLTGFTAALDAGASLDHIVRTATHPTLTTYALARLASRDIPSRTVDLILETRIDYERITSVLDAGGTWDDVTTILASRSPDRSAALSHYVDLLGGPARDAGIPAPVLREAALLASAITLTPALDMLPAAAAITGQPWAATVTTLLDDAGRPLEPNGHTAILTARALDKDPTLPPPAPSRAPWIPPAPLTEACAARGERDPQAVLAAAGVDPDTAAEALTWLGGLAATLARRDSPAGQTLDVPVLHTLAAALAHGATITDIRLAATLVNHNEPLGLDGAALALGCGVPLTTLEEWARDERDVLSSALLTAYGLDAAAITDIIEHDPTYPHMSAESWHAVELLAGGVAREDLLTVLPVFTGTMRDSMWPYQADLAHSGLPLPPPVITAIAEVGLSAWQLPALSILQREDTEPVPDEVAILVVNASAAIIPGADPSADPRASGILAYAAAAAGQPWTAHVGDLAGHLDSRIALARQVLDARGITSPARTITRPVTSPEARGR